MKPLIGKRIGATKSFRCLAWTRFSWGLARGPSVFLSLAKPCKRTLQPVRRSAVGTVVGVSQQWSVPSTKQLFVWVSSSAVVLRCFSCCWAHASELQLNTDWRNENHLRVLETKQLARRGPTRSTVRSKLGALEFRLACYQWGNSWCLYSFCLIGRRLGLALFGRATIGFASELVCNVNWQ